MRAEAVDFSELPHTSKLFLDFLAQAPSARSFYPERISSVGSATGRAQYPADRRAAMADILRRQNRSFGSSALTMDALARFAEGADAVVTGQQVVLFGGPLLSIFKALTALRLARDFSTAERAVIPIFWLATQDHDFAEVDHAMVLGADRTSLMRIAVAADGSAHAPVASRPLQGASLEAALKEIEAALGSETAALLRECYRPGASLGDGMGRLFAKLFAEFGLVLFDPSDSAVAKLALPVYEHGIRNAAPLTQSLLERGQTLKAAGYHEQVKVTSGSTLLFVQQDGERTVVHRENHRFAVGKKTFTPEALLQLLQSKPEAFSGNALLRPIVQDFLFPTLAYIGGPAEIAYFAQSEVVYRAILGRVTPVLPRCSATLIDQHSTRILQKYSLRLPELLHGPDAARLRVGEANLPPALKARFEGELQRFNETEMAITADLQRLDPTLVKAAGRSFAKMRYQLTKLRGKSARAQVRRGTELSGSVEKLVAALAPARNLQERERAGIDLLARNGPALLQSLYESVDPEWRAHHLLYL